MFLIHRIIWTEGYELYRILQLRGKLEYQILEAPFLGPPSTALPPTSPFELLSSSFSLIS